MFVLVLFSETFNSKTIEKIVYVVIIFIFLVIVVSINALKVFSWILKDKIFFILFFLRVVACLKVSHLFFLLCEVKINRKCRRAPSNSFLITILCKILTFLILTKALINSIRTPELL